jgi:hypothetical protein
VDGELVDGELVDGELVDGELVDGELVDLHGVGKLRSCPTDHPLQRRTSP